MRLAATIILTGFLCGAGLCGGCVAADGDLPRQLQDKDPQVRIRAIAHAAEIKDDKSVPYLVECLASDESDVRFFAFIALQKITGQTMGYRYYESTESRNEAIRRWREWAKERPISATRPKGG